MQQWFLEEGVLWSCRWEGVSGWVVEFTQHCECCKMKNAIAVVVAGCDKSMNKGFL